MGILKMNYNDFIAPCQWYWPTTCANFLLPGCGLWAGALLSDVECNFKAFAPAFVVSLLDFLLICCIVVCDMITCGTIGLWMLYGWLGLFFFVNLAIVLCYCCCICCFAPFTIANWHLVFILFHISCFVLGCFLMHPFMALHCCLEFLRWNLFFYCVGHMWHAQRKHKWWKE